MQVTEWYIIKSLTVPSSWVALMSSFVLMGLLLWILYRKEIASIFSDAVLQFVLIWKFSVIVTDFSSVIKHPLTILYFNGGMMGLVAGILFMCISLWHKIRQRGFIEEDLHAVFVSIILCTSFYQILMSILNEAALWQKVLTITSFTCWVLLALWKRNARALWHNQLLLLFLCTHLFIATLQPLGIWQISVLVTAIFVLFNILLQPRRVQS